MKDIFSSISTIVGCAVLLVVASMLTSLPMMWLWNWLIPNIFGLTTLTWLQAWGMTFLCGILFKGKYSVNTKK